MVWGTTKFTTTLYENAVISYEYLYIWEISIKTEKYDGIPVIEY